MGQEKTQRENGREQRNEQQGGLRGGWASGTSCGPVPAWRQGKESGPPATADLVGPVLSQPEVLGIVHSCLGLTIQPPSSRPSLPWTRAPSMPSSDGEASPGSRMPVT